MIGTSPKVLVPKFKSGQKPTGTITARDYEDAVKAAILSAIRSYEGAIVVRNAYASDAERVRWAAESWQSIFVASDYHYELTSPISRLVSISLRTLFILGPAHLWPCRSKDGTPSVART